MLLKCAAVCAALASLCAAHGTTYYSGATRGRGYTTYAATAAGSSRYPNYYKYNYGGSPYYHNRPTYATTSYNYPSSSSSSSSSSATADKTTSNRPWWNSYFPGASLPDEREVFPEWFEVDEADQCEDVPDSVNTGRPRDVCGEDDLGVRFCICMKRPRHLSVATGYGSVATASASVYEPICGECRDPCALRFIPDTFPRRNNNNHNDDLRDDDRERDRDRNDARRDRDRGRRVHDDY